MCWACQHPRARAAPDDADRRYWLLRFSDEEVVMLAWALDGGFGSSQAVAVWRHKLLVPAGGNFDSQRVCSVTLASRTASP